MENVLDDFFLFVPLKSFATTLFEILVFLLLLSRLVYPFRLDFIGQFTKCVNGHTVQLFGRRTNCLSASNLQSNVCVNVTQKP